MRSRSTTQCISTYHLLYCLQLPRIFQPCDYNSEEKSFFFGQWLTLRPWSAHKKNLIPFTDETYPAYPKPDVSFQGVSPWQGWSQLWIISRQTGISHLFVAVSDVAIDIKHLETYLVSLQRKIFKNEAADQTAELTKDKGSEHSKQVSRHCKTRRANIFFLGKATSFY